MNKTSELYQALFKELDFNCYNPNNNIYKKYVCSCGEGVVYSLSVRDRTRALSIPILSSNQKMYFPIWKGVDIVLVTLPEYSNDDQLYIQLRQMQETESYIFEIVAEDIRKGIDKAETLDDFAPITQSILRKWKDFFSTGKSLTLNGTSAQGLYGELLFLKELINGMGSSIVNSWAGVDNETHDFYVGQNAVEVKTTTSQAPYMAHVNSEYQLDDSDVNGRLFLRMYAFRKDLSGGERLPIIIREIRELLINDEVSLDRFNDKLNKVGYFDVAEDHYMDGYTIRDMYSFEVKEGFPRITRTQFSKGIYDLEYSVSISQCMGYAIEAKDLTTALKG